MNLKNMSAWGVGFADGWCGPKCWSRACWGPKSTFASARSMSGLNGLFLFARVSLTPIQKKLASARATSSVICQQCGACATSTSTDNHVAVRFTSMCFDPTPVMTACLGWKVVDESSGDHGRFWLTHSSISPCAGPSGSGITLKKSPEDPVPPSLECVSCKPIRWHLAWVNCALSIALVPCGVNVVFFVVLNWLVAPTLNDINLTA